MNMPRYGITARDIAVEAGVSTATVSRAMNHRHQVSVDTYNKIQDAMDRLGFDAPQSGERISKKENRVVIVNLPQLGNSVHTDFVNGITSSASRYGWYVLINIDMIDAASKEHFLHILRSSRAVGLIAMNATGSGVLEYLNAELPVVQCMEVNSAINIPYVGVDDAAASQMAVEYLIKKGHRNIALAQADAHMLCTRARQRGYEAALAKHNLKLDPANVITSPVNHSTMISSTVKRALTTMETIPDAVFASCDEVACATINAVRELGYRVPEDIAVVGYDNSNLSEISMPKLSSVNIPKFQLGFLACEILHEQHINPPGRVRNVTLDTELIIRQSS